MFLPTIGRGLRPAAPAEDRLGRLCKVFDRARVSYSRAHPEHALIRLPLAAMPTHLPKVAGQAFSSPLRLPSRTAALEANFNPDAKIRAFTSDDIGPLVDYEPEALIVPLLLALALADQRRRPQVSNWMVVLTSLSGVPFEQRHRDQLWRAFEVPVFEQLRGWDGTVIARECEVHDGLHVDENNAILEVQENELITTSLTTLDHPVLRARTGLTAELLNHHCECGAETPRLRNIAPLHQPKARFAVA